MRARIVRIGNSRGVRIPKPLLEEAGLEDEVELSVGPEGIVVAPARRPRAGWADAFRCMADAGDDAVLDGDRPLASSWDEDEWEWE